MSPHCKSLIVALAVAVLSGCTTYHDLSHYPPFNKYAGRDVPLQSPMYMPDTSTLGTVKLPSGSVVRITEVYLQKDWIHGPIIPCLDPTTQIYAAVSYREPKTRKKLKWNYPLGQRAGLYGYADKISVAPWESSSTPQSRYVGRNGKQYRE